MRSDWNIICDFDGTVSIGDVTDRLLQALGEPGWEALEQDWNEGRIGSRECMTGQVALLGGDRDALDVVLDSVGIDPYFEQFARTAQRLRMPLTIVSDGLDYSIARILQRCGLESLPVAANHLVRTETHRWRMTSPHAAPNCGSGTCKCAYATAWGGRSTLLVGDGRSDFCVAERADFVFAKDRLLEHCCNHGIAHRPMRDFAEATLLLHALAEGRLHDAPASFIEPLSIQYV
ncbi:MAG: HAD-IB family phosphatase [Xanthomonadaceae bacterium]|nr:HAD-IB family phosphatase [Xanthomonadaceae bacterium]